MNRYEVAGMVGAVVFLVAFLLALNQAGLRQVTMRDLHATELRLSDLIKAQHHDPR